MRTRIRSVSAAVVALVLGLSLAAAGCGKYSFSALKAQKAYKDGQRRCTASGLEGGGRRVRGRRSATDPNACRGAIFYLGEQLRQPLQAEPERASRRTTPTSRRRSRTTRRPPKRTPNPQMRKLAMQYLVAAYGPEKLNNPAEGRADRQEDDRDGAERADQLFRAVEDLRGRRPLRRGRADAAQGARRSSRTTRRSTPTLSGFYNRQGDFEKTIEALNTAADLEPKNPQGYQLVAAYYWEKAFKDHRLTAGAAEGIHREGHRGDRQGAVAEPGLRRRADLQEHPAAHAGEPARPTGPSSDSS